MRLLLENVKLHVQLGRESLNLYRHSNDLVTQHLILARGYVETGYNFRQAT